MKCGNQTKLAKAFWCYWWDIWFLCSSAALPRPMPGEKPVIQSHLVYGIIRSVYAAYVLCSHKVKILPYPEHAMASKRRAFVHGWFSYHLKYVTSKQNQGNAEMMMILKMSHLFPLWHFPSGSTTPSKHGSNSDKFTSKYKWQTHLKCIVCSK